MVCFAVALVVAAFLTGMAHLILSVLYEGFVEGFVRPFVRWGARCQRMAAHDRVVTMLPRPVATARGAVGSGQHAVPHVQG